MMIKQRQSYMKYIGAAFIGLMVLAAVGCETTSQFRDNGLPAAKYLVGGGLEIEWRVPQPGTVFWVEETTTKILQTKTVNLDEVYEQDLGMGDPAEFAGIFGIPFKDSRFSLYFIPNKSE